MLELLPTELQEHICGLLDGVSLLRAACVSTQWNSVISVLQCVWRQVCLRDGFGPAASDWKHQYVSCLKRLQQLKEGKAFLHRNFAPKCFHSSDVRDVAYWDGSIIAGIHKYIRIWRVEDLKPAATLELPYEVFCLSVSQNILGIGHYDGMITTWLLECVQEEVKLSPLQQYVGHTDNVVCLSIAQPIDILCSGSRDRTVKLWTLGSGQLIRTLPACGWVAQVMLVPNLQEHRHALLVADQSNIRLYSWLLQCNGINAMQVSNLGIPVDKKISMRKFLVQGRHILFVRDCAIVVQDLCTLEELNSFQTDCRDMVLLGIGARYVLLTMWDGCQKNSKLVTIELSNGQLVGTYPMPFCREYVVTGDTEWLDGVSHWKPRDLVAAGWMMGVLHMNQLTDLLYLINWRDTE